MSISLLFDKNNTALNCGSLNCETINNVKQSVITNETNSVGQVLQIININPNEVEFQDIPKELPSTNEYPNGYVLKILDNIENTYVWSADTTGGTVPLILTGESTQAFVVRADILNPPLISCNTTIGTTSLDGSVRVRGVNSPNKFTIQDATFTNVFLTNTTDKEIEINGKTIIKGVDDEKFKVIRNDGTKTFSVDTLNNSIYLGQGLPQSIEMISYEFPQPIPSLGITNNLNINVKLDEGGVGDNSFVGYIASNGQNKMYNLVNNVSCGLFFTAPNAGIQTTANIFNISGDTTNSQCNIDFSRGKVYVKGKDDNSITLSNNLNKVDIQGEAGITLTTNTGVIEFESQVQFNNTFPQFSGFGAPTLANEFVNKGYVDEYVNKKVSFFSMISNSPSANEISPLFANLLGGTFSPNSTLTVPADNFVVGDSFHLTISGSCNFNGTPPNATIGTPTAKNLTLTLLSNAVVLNTLVIPTRNTGVSSFFEVETDFTIRSIGVSGSIVNSFEFTYQIPSTTSFEGTRGTTIGTIDTTISNTLTCVATLDTGYSSASIQAFMAVLRKTK
jgi:hypothetical protein